jgi:hypothetical protein
MRSACVSLRVGAPKRQSFSEYRGPLCPRSIAPFCLLLTIVSLFLFSCKKVDVEALSKIKKIAVDFYIDTSFKFNVIEEMAGLSLYNSELYSLLVAQSVAALKETSDRENSRGIEILLLEGIHEDPTEVLRNPKGKPGDILKSWMREIGYRSRSKRKKMTPTIAKETEADAVLWIHAQYGGTHTRDSKISTEDRGEIIELVIEWSTFLLGASGRTVWQANFVTKKGDEKAYFGFWESSQSGTTVTDSMMLEPVAVLKASAEMTKTLSRDLVSRLTERIVSARMELARSKNSSESQE